MFKKADEMEIYITRKSGRIAWVYSGLFLLIWSVYDYVQTQRLGLPLILLLSQNIVFWLSQLIIKKRVTAGNEE